MSNQEIAANVWDTVGRTFSSYQELKQRASEQEQQREYQNKALKQAKDLAVMGQNAEDRRVNRTFQVNQPLIDAQVDAARIKLKEDQYQAEQLEMQRKRDLEPMAVSQDPYLSFFSDKSKKAVDMIQKDMMDRNVIKKGVGGFVITGKDRKDYFAGLDADPKRAQAFMETARQDLEDNKATLKAQFAELSPKDKQNSDIPQKLDQIEKDLAWTVKNGTKLEQEIFQKEQEHQMKLGEITATGVAAQSKVLTPEEKGKIKYFETKDEIQAKIDAAEEANGGPLTKEQKGEIIAKLWTGFVAPDATVPNKKGLFAKAWDKWSDLVTFYGKDNAPQIEGQNNVPEGAVLIGKSKKDGKPIYKLPNGQSWKP